MHSSINEHMLGLVAMSPTIVYTSMPRPSLGVSSMSDNVVAHLGHEPRDFIDDPQFWADHIHPDDRDEAVAELQEVFGSGHVTLTYRFLHRDGSYRWMYDQARVVRDERGEPIEVVGYWIDISALKRLEQDVFWSSERHRSLVEAMPYGLDEVDRDGTIIFGNRALHELYGYDDGEMIGMSILDLCLTDDDRRALRSEMLADLSAAAPNRTPYHGRRKRKDGSIVDVEVAWNHRLGPDGDVVGTTAVVTDVSERLRAEAALRESERRFDLAVSGADEGLWDKDLLTGKEYWAPRFFELIGYGVDEIESTNAVFESLLHPDDRRRVFEAYSNHLQHHSSTYQVEYRFRTKSGHYKWFRSRARAIWDETDTPVRMLGFITDITDERALHAALRETRQILDSTPDPLLIVDERGTIVFANSHAKEFGYSTDELLGSSIVALLPVLADPHTGFHTHIGAVMVRGLESRGRRKDGTEFPVEVSLSPIDTDSGRLMAAAVRDISRRKRDAQRQQVLEAKLRQSQKLESMGVLAGGIAHDFNNLLMGVLGNADVVLQQLPAASPARAEVGNIIAAALSAAELTKQMLAYSGKGKFVVEPIDLASLVQDIGHLLESSISKNVRITYDFADDLPAIDADATQIQQVAMNLIINASEALESRSGDVVVRTSTVEVDETYFSGTYFAEDLPIGSYVCFEVSDTGCGMDEQTQQKIFDPFFSTKFSGRGLGLAAVLGIIRGHNGALRIRSTPQEGSTFTVLFPPSSERAEDSGVAAPQTQPWRGHGTVLVVDDVETVRDAMKRMIETQGFSVITADDGDVAIDLFREQFRDIVAVVLDMTMPRMDGEQTFYELRRIDPDVKVILSSGFDEMETTGRFTGAGPAGFIQKPYRVRQLVDALRLAVDGP